MKDSRLGLSSRQCNHSTLLCGGQNRGSGTQRWFDTAEKPQTSLGLRTAQLLGALLCAAMPHRTCWLLGQGGGDVQHAVTVHLAVAQGLGSTLEDGRHLARLQAWIQVP